MKQRLFAYCAVIAGALLVAGPASAQSSNDTAIRDVEGRQEQAWNGHDARAYMQLFADDADIIDIGGAHWKGRAEAEPKLAAAFSSVFARSRLHVEDVSIRPLSDNMVLAYVSWSMTGGPSGDAPQRGVQTQVLQKTDGRWLILSFQNTSAMSERPVTVAAAAVQPTETKPAATAPAARPAETDTRGCLLGTRTSCLIYKGKKS